MSPATQPRGTPETGLRPEGHRAISNFRWFIVGLLFLATTINYIDRQILALLKSTLDQELGWTNEQFGLVNSVFFGCYAASYISFGWFIDKAGVKLGFAVSLFWWSLAALSHALASSVGGFVCARVALGTGEGGNFPACIKAIAVWFPKRERALAASLFNAGANAGPVVAPAIIPWIALRFGWRMAFIAAGLAGFLWLFLWLPFYNDSPARSRFVSASEAQTIESDGDEQSSTGRVPWLRLFSLRQTWAIVLAKFLTDPVSWFFLIWLPDFFNKTRGLDIKSSWPHLVTIYLLAGVLSIGAGWLSGFFINCGWTATRAPKTGMLIAALCVLPILLVRACSNWPAVCFIGLAIAAHQAWCANIYASESDMFPKSAVAAVAGIGGMAGAVGGMIFPWAAGRLLDHYHQTVGGETGGYAVLFGICAGAYLVALLLNHLLAPRYEQIKVNFPS